METTAWKSGSHNKTGGGYGLKIRIGDRDRYFDRNSTEVLLELEGLTDPIPVNINKPSFWNETCHELISKDIGLWLIANILAPWQKGMPPKIELIPLSQSRFAVKLPNP